ncbi:MAG TPA: ABC transporter ATP-binding protein [Streptosporangiaceae bacterium]|jgi:ATP-binding cassette subfamily B protein
MSGRLSATLADAVAMAWRASPVACLGQVGAAVLAGLTPVAGAWLLRAILDGLSGGHAQRVVHLVVLSILMAAAGGATALLPNLSQYLAAQSGLVVRREATIGLFSTLSRLHGLRLLEDPAFQDQLRLAEQAGSSGPGQIMSGAISIVQSVLTLSGFLITLLLLNPVLAAALVIAAIPVIYLERRIARQQVALITGITKNERRQLFYQQLMCSLHAAKEIRLFGLGAYFSDRMLDELGQVIRASRHVNRRVLAGNAAMAGTSAVVAGAGLVWAVTSASAGRLSLGDVAVYVTALGSVAIALGMVINAAAMSYRSLLLFGSYRDVLAQEPDLTEPAQPAPAGKLRRGIELDDVWFRYGPDTPWVLRGVSCFISHGQSLAVVGHNGAGKSTLVKLLCRFYDPDRGRILWDGVDLRDLDVPSLRERISAVFQDYMTYDLTAAENIELGELKLAGQADAVGAAASRAGIHEALAALPRGYQTLLTRSYLETGDDDPQSGVLLSGGQWQRVALARAFLRGSRDLMILDEPSSGLDAEAEHEIHASLARDRRGAATVLVSHRLNTVRDADHIVVLSGGVISEQGGHDALMAAAGIYARLFSLQARGFEQAATRMGVPSE